MGTKQIIQKIVNGRVFSYDRKIDTIYLTKGESDIPDTSEIGVEIYHEVTTKCNHFCANCFSNSGGKSSLFHYRDFSAIQNTMESYKSSIIRHCITGGEPFFHPQIKEILDLPLLFPDTGFAIVGNGTLIQQYSKKLIDNGWSTIISLHGREKSHNQYTSSNSFKKVVKIIENLAIRGYVNIYTVLHNYLTPEDVMWLLEFRDEIGAGCISFLKPRPFGRFTPFSNDSLLKFIEEIRDNKTKLRYEKENLPFIDVKGVMRRSN
jgi:MoaA/NifB/PqqE/SkfB family radical SAM enzyme